MVNSGNILGQIGESFETIGKGVASEATQIPKDITGTALESLGISSGKKSSKQSQPQQTAPQSPEQQQNTQVDEEMKRAIARAALEEISGKGKQQQKELTVWEKLQKEEEEKKEMEKKKQAEAARQSLPSVSTKRKRGDLYGMKAKKAAAEMSRNVRQD